MQADKALDEKAQLMYEKMKLQKQQEAAVLQKKAATTGAAEAPKPTPVKPEAVSYSHRLTACRMLVLALPVRKSKPTTALMQPSARSVLRRRAHRAMPRACVLFSHVVRNVPCSILCARSDRPRPIMIFGLA